MKDWVEFFKKISFTYYRSSLIQQKYIDVINRNVNEGDLLMEIASGSGYTSAIVGDLTRTKGAKVIASDIDSELVEKISEIHPVKNLEARVVDAFDTKLPDDSIDLIFHQGFLEHFEDDDILKLLAEQGRVAKTIVFDVPNSRRWKKVQEFGNERFLSHSKWIALTKKAGLKVVFHTGRRFSNPWKKFVPKAIYDSDWFGRVFGESSIIVCAKLNKE
jgi:ubiquinone/menaquinone biosynthesis C-methylase UbiE